MQVIRQNDPGGDPERALGPRDPGCIPQRFDLLDQKPRAAVGQPDGEEHRGTWNAAAAEARHARQPNAKALRNP